MAKITVTYEFDNEEEVRSHFGQDAMTRAIAPTAAPVTTRAADADADTEPTVTADIDADSMPYDSQVHAEPRSFTADGLWRAKRGQSGEANRRRAEFKAGGGAIVTTAPTIAPVMPGMPLPVAETRAEPISYEMLSAKFSALAERGLIDAETMIAMYPTLGIDPTTFGTNESARAVMFAALVKLEG